MAKAVSVIDELRAARRSTAAVPCMACQEPFLSVLREIQAAIRQGTLTAAQAPSEAITRILRARGYTRSSNALRQHLRVHQPDLWALLRPGE